MQSHEQHCASTGTPKASTPSWDADSCFQPAQPAQRQSSHSQLHAQPRSTRPPSQPARYAASNGQSVAQPSWQGSPRGAGAGWGGAEGSASDPFANLPAPIAQTSNASTSYQASGNGVMADSLFSGLSTGRHYLVALLKI